MLLTMFHGLLNHKKQNNIQEVFKPTVSNALMLTAGKHFGSYSLDDHSQQVNVKTINLPDFSDTVLRSVQLNFNLEQIESRKGPFIIATVTPISLNNKDIIPFENEYIKAITGRKYITYSSDSGWTAWTELNSRSPFLVDYTVGDNNFLPLILEPLCIDEYFLRLGSNSTVVISSLNLHKFKRSIFLEFVSKDQKYTIVYPKCMIWKTNNGLPPPVLKERTRLRIEIKQAFDDCMVATYEFYKVV